MLCSARSRRVVALTLVGLGAAAVTARLVLHGSGGTVGALKNIAGTGGSCAGVTEHVVGPDGAWGYPSPYSRRARRIEVIGCDAGGPVTVYMRFRSADDATAAIARFPEVRRRGICRIGDETFDTDLLGHPRRVRTLCARLGGRRL